MNFSIYIDASHTRNEFSDIEQTQSTDLPSVPQTTKFSLTQPFRTANNTVQYGLAHTFVHYIFDCRLASKGTGQKGGNIDHFRKN